MLPSKLLQSCLTLCNLMSVAHQARLSMRFSRQEYWSGLPFPLPGDLPDSGIKPMSFFFFLLFLPWFLSHDPLHLPAIESAVEGQKDLLGSHHWDKPMSFKSPALAGGFFTTSATWEALVKTHNFIIVTRCHVGQKVHWSNSLRTNLNELFGQPNRYKNFTAEYFFLISLSLFSQKLHEGRDDYLLPSSVPGTQQVSESYSNESVLEISCSKKATDIVRKPRK